MMTSLIGRRCSVQPANPDYAAEYKGRAFEIVALTYAMGSGWLALVEERSTGTIEQFMIGNLRMEK